MAGWIYNTNLRFHFDETFQQTILITSIEQARMILRRKRTNWCRMNTAFM